MKEPNAGAILGCAGRQHTKDVIKQRIHSLEQEIEQLKLLDAALPWKDMTQQEEEKLWNFFINLRRS